MVHDNVLYTWVGKSFETTKPAVEGEIAIETAGGVYDTADLAGLDFRIVKYNGKGELEYSPWYKDTACLVASSHVYAAPVQSAQTLTVPDAGVLKDELYSFWIVVKDTMTTYANKAMMKSAAYKTTRAAQPAAEIASGLVANFNMNMAREPEAFVVAEVRSSEAGDALGAAPDTVVGAAGSKTVVVTDTTSDSSCTAVAVGDFFRPGTAVTDPVYLVTASTVTVDGGTLTLDRPLVDACDLLGTTSEVVTAADAAAADTTIVFTGQARTNFEAGIWKYMVYDFDVLPGDIGVVTQTANAFQGALTEDQIKEQEWFAMGNRGYGYRQADFLPVASQLTSQSVYDTLINANGQKGTYLKFRDVGFVNVVGQTPGSLSEHWIYMPSAEMILMNIVLNTATSISGLTAA